MGTRCSTQMMIDILHARVGVPPNTPNIDTVSWEELGVESLGLTEVCSSLEYQLNITVPQEEAFSTRNIQEFVAFINSIQA